MVLVRKGLFAYGKCRNNEEAIFLEKLLVPRSKKFNEIINKVDLSTHYDKKMIRVGSIVQLSTDEDHYYFGINDECFKLISGSTQTIAGFLEDGEVIFENPENRRYLDVEYVNYGISEIDKIIKY